MTIEWTLSASKDLKDVFEFYRKTVNRKVAQKIKNEILFTTNNLKLGTGIGQIEQRFKDLNQGHRYLLSNHCKILYFLKNDTIYITHVFDTRQNPEDLK